MCAVTTFPLASGNGGALIASPCSILRGQLMNRLEGRWRSVQQVLGGAEALEKLEQGEWQVLFLDRRLRDLDSEELIRIIERRFPEIQMVLLDSEAAFPSEAGDEDRRPEITFAVREAGPIESSGQSFASREIEREKKLQEQEQEEQQKEEDPEKKRLAAAEGYEPLPGMIGHSPAMQSVYRLARLVAPRTTTVLIVGPTGSGKELVARALHLLSSRASKPFISVNCAAIPEALLESELFGHARGAFTGAVQAQVGRIPAAHGGTLFLDEISELPFAMQAKLLRFLEQKEVQRLGTSEVTRVDVRVIAASNVDMAGRAGRGEFREDLFYRLAAFPLELPPLGQRRADIVPLAEYFLACMAAAMNMPAPRISVAAARILEAHCWKGNVRELQHVMERASILIENQDTVLEEHLYFPFQPSPFHTAAGPLSCAPRAS